MALSRQIVQGHITAWAQSLAQPAYYAHRQKWPNYLFHHSPLQNAAEILRGGQLRSRNDPGNNQPIDVAAPGVIDARQEAHDFVRMYFRPCTPTQYHIEGIRKVGECRYGDQSHAPILIMFVLNAEAILTRPGTQFSDRNMQMGAAEYSDTPEYFAKIPFGKVYHLGGTNHDPTIIQHRCAEVLAVSPMPLNETLQWIYCRSTAERETLLFQLRGSPIDWSQRIIVSDDLKVFQREYAFVEIARITNTGITFQLNPRNDNRKVSIEINLWDRLGGLVASFINPDFAPRPPNALQWHYARNLVPGQYRLQISLEGNMAYLNDLTLDDPLF